jgi:hypothetical protein
MFFKKRQERKYKALLEHTENLARIELRVKAETKNQLKKEL